MRRRDASKAMSLTERVGRSNTLSRENAKERIITVDCGHLGPPIWTGREMRRLDLCRRIVAII